MGAFQREVEIRILQHMHSAVHHEWKPQSQAGMFKWICKGTNVSQSRFDEAFTSLQKMGYFTKLDSSEGEEAKWKLSGWGIDWVEDYYSFRETDESLTYWPTYGGMIMIGTRREKYLNELAAKETDNLVKVRSLRVDGWTRSGVLAAWAGAILTMIGLIIAFLALK